MSNGNSVRWSFVRHSEKDGTTWLWQRFGPNGLVEKTSEPHVTYGKAMTAALQNGFRPDRDDYSVDIPAGRMHFPPGRIPEFSPTSETIEAPPAPEPRHSRGLSPLAFTLLQYLHQAAHGGPPAPRESLFQYSYDELVFFGLAMHESRRMKITDKGEGILRDRHLSKDRTH
jgi:hypothetical protein